MPGRNLSNPEKALRRLWQHPPAQFIRPSLRSIEITGGTGLRGIDSLKVSFRYPITAICGNNGSGKSTILALSALAYHSPKGWTVYSGNTEPMQSGKDRTYYTFSTFFINGSGEGIPDGVSITWRYDQQSSEVSRNFKKKGNRWGRYDTRPERELYYLPLGRVLPANELSVIRSAFHNPIGTLESTLLNAEYINYLSYIMGRTYSEAEIQKSNKYRFPCCTTGIRYTAFNMGGGESCMIILLHLLQQLPFGGMLVAEEIEAGLHPQAQIRLSEKLVDICRRKALQVICTTHSETFLDALPREARLVIKQSGEEHSTIESPSTRLAMFEMTGEFKPELIIYCEDEFASVIIEESLPSELRVRVKIQPVGTNSAIMRQGVSHIRAGFDIESLCVFDGDCKKSEIRGWRDSERGERTNILPEYLLLPGAGLPPEKWVILQLHHDPYKENFTRELGCSATDTIAHLSALSVELDHHNIPYTLHQRTSFNIDDCIRRMIRSLALQHPQLDELRDKVRTLLS